MLFNSWAFVAFFLLVYGLYLSCWGLSNLAVSRGWTRLQRVIGERGYQAQNAILLPASLFFYAWFDWRFVILLVATMLVDFWVARLMTQDRMGSTRKPLLLLSVISNLAILGFFKYYDFFAASVGAGLRSLGFEVSDFTLDLILPWGISFYTFQSLSYTIEVYRRQLAPKMSPGRWGLLKDFTEFALFISFFPHLVAGPIMRATSLLPQVQTPRRVTAGDIDAGLWLIIWGFFKKIVIADRAAGIANEVFNHWQAHSGVDIVIGALAFAVQIYCDFSAYTDIARGTARLMGFDIVINFKLPYFALNPSDFWRRWHISLSSWLRDYLYIPLGGNRKGPMRTNINLFITMLLGGLWHGAAWNFVIWGAFHGLLLILYRPFTPKDLDASPPRTIAGFLNTTLAMSIMFVLTLIGWVIFRAVGVEAAPGVPASTSTQQIWGMFTSVGFETTQTVQAASGQRLGTLAMLIPLAWVIAPLLLVQIIQHHTRDLMAPARMHPLVKGPVYALMLAIITVFGVRESVEFIYFQF